MSHNHIHIDREPGKSNLLITMLLNFLITIAEIIGGIFSGSLSLISDALHNFSDGVSIIITYIAIRISKRPKSLKYTFGLKRAEILAAIINSSTLIIISFYLIKEAIERFYNPAPVTGGLMLLVASAGLIANVSGTFLLRKGARSNINIRASYFHLLSDAISSLAVIIGAIFIIYFKIYWIDPLLTILISMYILKETYSIIKEAVNIIMMASPQEINLQKLKKIIEEIPEIKNIHHVHIWKLNDNDIHFESHIEVNDILISDTLSIQKMIEEKLHKEFDINHFTFQFECDRCTDKELI